MTHLDLPQRPGRTVLHLSWPLIMFMLGQTVMGLVDTKLVGSLGAQALGGVGLATALLYAASIFMVGLMRGVKVCMATPWAPAAWATATALPKWAWRWPPSAASSGPSA